MIFSRKKFYLLLGVLSFTTLLNTPQNIYAATPKCQFNAEISQLNKLLLNQNDNQSGVMTELKLRKDILLRTLICGTEEFGTLRAKLVDLNPINDEAKTIKSRLIKNIDEISKFYGEQQNKIGDLGIRGTKDTARATLDWRKANYLPLATKIENFLAWHKNQAMFKSAEDRFVNIRSTIQALKLVEDDGITPIFEEAEGNLKAAAEANNQARVIFLSGTAENPLPAMRLALEKLADTYQTFFALSEKVNTLIPNY